MVAYYLRHLIEQSKPDGLLQNLQSSESRLFYPTEFRMPDDRCLDLHTTFEIDLTGAVTPGICMSFGVDYTPEWIGRKIVSGGTGMDMGDDPCLGYDE